MRLRGYLVEMQFLHNAAVLLLQLLAHLGVQSERNRRHITLASMQVPTYRFVTVIGIDRVPANSAGRYKT